jgi:hypothetical protein
MSPFTEALQQAISLEYKFRALQGEHNPPYKQLHLRKAEALMAMVIVELRFAELAGKDGR